MACDKTWSKVKNRESKKAFSEGHERIFSATKSKGVGCGDGGHDFSPILGLEQYSRCKVCGKTVATEVTEIVSEV